ncbi:peptide ABC transporter substrate-binding protein [Labedella phragmitis]|uniref:Peptide ABC transporter substrate-binding protein n=1 Tax=Labedella phragmitis TaxID=2498849 RepID=A0A444PVU0_9MICO|nr:ABC transporter substrate-binding protein [Labedella phragmitis]RWZ51992.1 peptide ABC transporter substrate-binding protein [Labedella phragmitis]
MTSASRRRVRLLTITAGATGAALILAGCAAGGSDNGDSGGSSAITVGTTDKVTVLDPAGSYDNGSFAVMNQVFPFLMNTPYGSPDVEPDIAESAEFTAPTQYTVTLKEGLTFANGNELTSSDVKFTFDRQLAIADENGPSSLLYNLDSVETPDELTAVFNLKSENDQIFPQILSSPAGPIVDEDVFSATELTSDDEIVEGKAFAGQYSIESYDFNNLISFTANPDYQGVLGAAENEQVVLQYFADSSNLKLAIQEGEIDVAHRSLSATDIADLEGNDDVSVETGPGGEIRYIVFNFDTQPFGAQTPEADEAKALAVRQAVADLIDRDALSDDTYKGTYTPLYSFVPEGLTGAIEPLKELYGDGEGGPSTEAAEKRLSDAGIDAPVELNLQYSNDHYGPTSGDEYAAIKSQLEESGLFTVNLQTTEWVQYSKDRTSDVYPLYQLGWFPDYSDADNYLTPFFLTDNFLANHYDNAEVNDKILEQASIVDPAERQAALEEIQTMVASDLSTIPYLQGAQVAVVGSDVSGVTLDASFKFRFAPITKG